VLAELIASLVLGQSCEVPVCTDGAQYVSGQKVATDLWQFTGSYSWGGTPVSSSDYYGHAFGGPLVPLLDGQSLLLQGSRRPNEPSADVIVFGTRARDAGGYFSVQSGDVTHAQLLAEDWKGNLTISPAPEADGYQASDVLHRGMLVCGNPASGSVCLSGNEGNYVNLEQRLAENHSAIMPDGGRPSPDGGFEVQCESDGGCFFSYAGKHGGFTFSSSTPQQQGWLVEAANYGVYGGASKFIVHATGAFGSANGLFKSEFPTCPSPLAMTSLGQFYPGVPPGVIAYAADEDLFYRCSLTGWVKF
jgi:hypothetical protein